MDNEGYSIAGDSYVRMFVLALFVGSFVAWAVYLWQQGCMFSGGALRLWCLT